NRRRRPLDIRIDLQLQRIGEIRLLLRGQGGGGGQAYRAIDEELELFTDRGLDCQGEVAGVGEAAAGRDRRRAGQRRLHRRDKLRRWREGGGTRETEKRLELRRVQGIQCRAHIQRCATDCIEGICRS